MAYFLVSMSFLFFSNISFLLGAFEKECFKKTIKLTDIHNFIVVSLGCNCAPAWYAREYGLRDFALPFDWCITPYSSLYHCFQADFKGYFRRKNLIKSDQALFNQSTKSLIKHMKFEELSEYFTWVLDSSIGMIYNHDFPDNNKVTIDKYYWDIFKKYKRRIERLYKMMVSGKHVYFIRYRDITKEEALQFYRLLKFKFPDTSFTLLVISDQEEFKEEWQLPYIKNYYEDKDLNHDIFWKDLCGSISSGKLCSPVD